MSKHRRTITLNLSSTSPLLVAAEARSSQQQRPLSSTMREVAEEALVNVGRLSEELEKERFHHKGTRADLAGDSAQLLAARAEIGQLKQSLANANSASAALSAELDRAKEQLERVREEYRAEQFRLKCSQEALSSAQEQIETIHSARRAEAEAEDWAAEKARIEQAEVDRNIIIAGLLCLRHRAAIMLDRKRAESDEV
jgi:chromosome segregation ATPase